MSSSRVVHTDDLPWEDGGHGDLFAHRRRRLARAAGGRALGCSMMELDPGKTAWPFHYHRANEEALYVLAGEATLRLGEARLRIRAGDYVALPVGPADAHQLTNTGSEVVRYLVVSTMVTPDVCVYPDANKVGVIEGLDDAQGRPRRVVTFPQAAEVGYWDGETTQLDGTRASQPRADAADAAAAPAGDAPSAPQPPASGDDTDAGDETHQAAEARRTQQARMVEDELEALKRKLAREELVESDLDALKRKLGRDD